MGFESKHEFASPTILLGLLLHPWLWGISSQQVAATAAKSLQVVTAAMKLKDAFSLEGKS